jgi:hypothetical protein
LPSADDRARGALAFAAVAAVVLFLFRRPSKDFTWAELTRTDTGLDNTPDLESRIRLMLLARQVLQPLRDAFGPIRVTSAYRSAAVNAAIPHSVEKSDHLLGNAADVYGPPGVSAFDLAAWLHAAPEVPLHQVIIEPTGHLHLSRVSPTGTSGRRFLHYPTWGSGRSWAPPAGVIS